MGTRSCFSLRMLGMFMVLPVLTTYGLQLQHTTESLIGLAIGIYGLTQAIFQILLDFLRQIWPKINDCFRLNYFIVGSLYCCFK